jgi:hypothetical protein
MRLGQILIHAVMLGALLAAGCGDSTTNGDAGTGHNNGGDGDKSGGDGDKSGGPDDLGQCGSQTQGKCTNDELQDYNDCLYQKCGTQFKAAFGDNFQSGEIGGACKDDIACYKKCSCDDQTCRTACATNTSQGCKDAEMAVGTCSLSAGCQLPACATQGTGLPDAGSTAGGHTCDELATCCAGLTDATTKMQCDTTYNAVKQAGDAGCNQIYSSFCH